jgi:apolipoprotein N-acyltransferase
MLIKQYFKADFVFLFLTAIFAFFFIAFHDPGSIIANILVVLLIFLYNYLTKVKSSEIFGLFFVFLRLPYLIFSLARLFSASAIGLPLTILTIISCTFLECLHALFQYQIHLKSKSFLLAILIMYFYEIIISSWLIFGKFAIPYSLGFMLLNTKIGNFLSIFGAQGAILFIAILCFAITKLNYKFILSSILSTAVLYSLSFFILIDLKLGQVSVNVVQPNMSNFERNLAYSSDFLQKVYLLDFISLNSKNTVNIWSEVALPGIYNKNTSNKYNGMLNSESFILTGAIRSENNKYYNSVVSFKGGKSKILYDKQTLVPFEEDWLTSKNKNMSIKINNATFGLFICMDVARQDIFEMSARSENQAFLLFVNNQNENSYLVQLKLIKIRALESGRSILVASQMGRSSLVQSDGTESNPLNWNVKASRIYKVPINNELTIFYKTRNFQVITLLLLFFTLFFRVFLNETKRTLH